MIIADDIEKLSNYRYELAVLMVNLRKKRGKQAKLSKKHTSLAIMGRMYGRGKGKAQSAIPYSRKAPAWVKVQIFTFLLIFFIKFASKSHDFHVIFKVLDFGPDRPARVGVSIKRHCSGDLFRKIRVRRPNRCF